ncbi:methyltransferase [Winogradskyella echinorum]|uniref:Methyltransferase n=1 Tax=Winogradskyella echinorum TaxID=538189 RepID=A0ABR6Y1C5_9FLAO|nr:DUF6250 domain-containing protein [Winogradskyella echinorum]MBC3846546.1 methyltransferase [Winogradskyella echinorum]MBC5750894.1 methyltransferase [Winogradskyella echinorum]
MKISIQLLFVIILGSIIVACKSSVKVEAKNTIEGYTIDELLYEDNFDKVDLSQWIIETDTLRNTAVKVDNKKLIIDVDCGATVWLKDKLSGNVLIEYDRMVVVENGSNDRLSDLNQFWMANDPNNLNLFTRNGTFSQYHDLELYYFGIGGRSNTTTRFRKYLGTGERYLVTDHTDPQYFLKPNKTYHIKTVIYNGTTKVFIDGEEYFSYTDSAPLTSGYFGFRTTKSRHLINNFKVYRLK